MYIRIKTLEGNNYVKPNHVDSCTKSVYSTRSLIHQYNNAVTNAAARVGIIAYSSIFFSSSDPHPSTL